MKKNLLLLFLIFCCRLVTAQEYKDQIITAAGDTISCHISLINPEQIYFSEKVGGKVISRFIPLSEIKKYYLNPKSNASIITDEIYQDARTKDSIQRLAPHNARLIGKRQGFSNYYIYNNKKLNRAELKDILQTVPASDEKIENNTALTVGSVATGFAAGYCFAYYATNYFIRDIKSSNRRSFCWSMYFISSGF
jgi:hypothetical protein